MARFTIELNVAEVNASLDKTIAEFQQGLEQGMREVAPYLEREHKLYFAKQEGPDGPWEPIKAATAARKNSNVILRETSALVSSLRGKARGLSARVSASQEYGIFHQRGTKHMPQRKFLGFKPEHEQRIVEILTRNLNT